MEYSRPGFEIEAGYGGAIAMALMPEDIATEIREWGMSHINDSEVYGVDGKGRDGSPHVTLQNGIMCDDSSELEKLFAHLPAMKASLGPIGVFRQDDKDYDVIHIEVLCDDLHAANAMVSDLLEVNNPHSEYRPHITLAYVKKGSGKRFDGLKDFAGKEVELGRLAIDGPNIEPKMIDLCRRDAGDKLEGGKADRMTEADFDPKELAEGAKHELEHTKNIELAREIAMDHLSEDPDYYKHLKAVEASKRKCDHTRDGKWCGRCEPLKESLDYGSKKAFLVEDAEDYILSSGRSVKDISKEEMERILEAMERG
jgi:2'-5' RNA ligase